jgi:hypothetical protein
MDLALAGCDEIRSWGWCGSRGVAAHDRCVRSPANVPHYSGDVLGSPDTVRCPLPEIFSREKLPMCCDRQEVHADRSVGNRRLFLGAGEEMTGHVCQFWASVFWEVAMKGLFRVCAAVLVLGLGLVSVGGFAISSASAQTRCNCNKGKQACVRCCDENKFPVGCKWGCDSCREPPKKKS